MATIDYKEKYEQALERASKLHDNINASSSRKAWLEDIFPELKESEGERTWIINYLSNRKLNSSTIAEKENLKKAIAWLEKHKYTEDDLDKAYKCADEVQYRRGYEDAKKEIEKQGKNNMGISEATKQKLEDNLNKALEKETPESWNEFLEKQGEQKPNPCENCSIATNNCQKFPCAIRDGEQKSEIDPYSLPVSDDSSLPIFDESIYHPCTEEVHEQNPADNEMKEILRAEYEKGMADAIAKMQEWSEEDEKMLQNVLECLRHGWKKLPTDILKYESWLKSLRPQNTWKPSVEQMEYLAKAITTLGNEGDNKTSAILYELRTDQETKR